MSEAYSWILRPCARPRARFRLFCFAGAGAGASSFRGWPEACTEEIEVALIQPPGRENRLREKPLQSMRTLVSSIATAMTEFLDRPYALYGHSLGAKVAFETTRELRRRELLPPLHLYVAASAGPGVQWAHPLLHPLDDLDILQEIQRRYGGVPQEVLADRELCALLVPGLRADLTIIETYQYTEERPLLNPITCLCGSTDSMTLESEAWDWRNQTCCQFRYETFPGGHFFPAQTRALILDLIATDLTLPSLRY